MIASSKRWVIVLLLLLYPIINITSSSGHSSAKRKVEYLIIDSHPEMVVLGIYGNDVVCAEFDRSLKKVYKKFQIIEKVNLKFRSEKIGPLKPE